MNCFAHITDLTHVALFAQCFSLLVILLLRGHDMGWSSRSCWPCLGAFYAKPADFAGQGVHGKPHGTLTSDMYGIVWLFCWKWRAPKFWMATITTILKMCWTSCFGFCERNKGSICCTSLYGILWTFQRFMLDVGSASEGLFCLGLCYPDTLGECHHLRLAAEVLGSNEATWGGLKGFCLFRIIGVTFIFFFSAGEGIVESISGWRFSFSALMRRFSYDVQGQNSHPGNSSPGAATCHKKSKYR